jgi:hypothetical protein
MKRPEGVNVTTVESPAVTSLPFQPYIKLDADRVKYSMGVAVDPRIAFKDTGKNLFFDAMGQKLFSTIARDDMLRTAMDLVNKLHWLHQHGELEVINHPVPLEPPMWEHDCDDCLFLGTHHQHDLYYCQGVNGRRTRFPTLVARYGSNGPQYKSGVPLLKHDDNLWAAAVLAEAQGHVNLLGGQSYMLLIDNKVV